MIRNVYKLNEIKKSNSMCLKRQNYETISAQNGAKGSADV